MNAKVLVMLVLSMLLAVSFAFSAAAIGVNIDSVKINGEEFDSPDHSNSLQLRRGEDIEIKVRLFATTNVDNVQIEADIYGYRYADNEEELVSDTTETFDMIANDTIFKELKVSVPMKIDKKYTKLRIRVGDEDSLSYEKVIQLHIVGVDDEKAVEIKDFSISPSDVITAGRALTAMVKVKNYGDDDLDDLKVIVSIPELGIRDSEYLDELNADETETFEELLLRIPTCADEGKYEVKFTVEFDEYESTSKTTTIYVTENEECGGNAPAVQKDEGKTLITVPQMQQVSKGGAGSVFPIALTNTGSESKTYTFSVTGLSGFATYRLDPASVVIVPGGATKTVYLYVNANENAEAGEKVFMLDVQSGSESKQIPLALNVVEDAKASGWGDIRTALEIGLIVLVIILIIIGLVIGFTKMKGNDENEQTYY